MIRGKTKEEYLNWLDTASIRELLCSLSVTEHNTIQKSFEKSSNELQNQQS